MLYVPRMMMMLSRRTMRPAVVQCTGRPPSVPRARRTSRPAHGCNRNHRAHDWDRYRQVFLYPRPLKLLGNHPPRPQWPPKPTVLYHLSTHLVYGVLVSPGIQQNLDRLAVAMLASHDEGGVSGL